MNLHSLKVNSTRKERKAFYASDFGKAELDIYFSFVGEPETNPIEWHNTLRMGAGKGVEEAMLKVLKDSGFVDESYDQTTDGRIEIERDGIKINGYIDAKTKDGFPIEIKSINNKNKFDIERYDNGEPRESYVGQLAIYCDALGVDKGYLLVASIDGLNRYLFECTKTGERKFKCGKTEVDLDKTYKAWCNLFTNHIEKKELPDVNKNLYKFPVKEIDWSKISPSDISKARNGHKVIGDWAVLYSNWKDKIVELQGTTLGYSPEELEFIKEQTKGYTSKLKTIWN